MRFRVVWAPLAENRLAELWLRSDDRKRITEAADRVDQTLAHTPTAVGESRAEGVRVFVEPPLTVFYTVVEDDYLVTVKGVWEHR